MRQVDLASAVNLSSRHLQKIESGTINLSVSTLDAIAKSLNIPACHLISDVCGDCLTQIGLCCPYEILDILPFGVFMTNHEGILIYTNKIFDEILGISEPYKKGPYHIWDFLYDSSDIEKSKQGFLQSKTSDKTMSQYAKLKSVHGSMIPVRFDIKTVLDTQNQNCAFLTIVTSHPSW